MLTCYGHSCRLAQGEYTYAAFRIAALANLDELQLARELGDDDTEQPYGFLSTVPLLRNIGLAVQIDLLGEVWAKQRRREPVEADLLDAAVVYAACREAERVFRDEPEVGRLYLREAPRSLRMRVRPEAAERFEDLFDRFWDDVDFLMLSDWQDMLVEHAEALKRQLAILPDDTPLYAALERGRLSPEFRRNLRGLLSAEEIDEALELDRPCGPGA